MKNREKALGLVALVAGFIAVTALACSRPASAPTGLAGAALSLSSPAFQDGETIPTKYSCDGQSVSPPLAWSGSPQGTRSFALIIEDPDAPRGVFTHWVIYNVPSASQELPEGVPAQDRLTDGTLQGKNDSGKIGYTGPCPPSGPAHHYRFTLYALDSSLSLEASASKSQVLDAIQGHILAQGQLTGLYQR